MISKVSKLKGIAKLINKRHGQGTIGLGASVNSYVGKRLDTGSLSLNYVLGGGIPYGRVTMFTGPQSCGKTYNTYMIIAKSQGICANCLRHVYGLKVVEDIDEETGEVSYYADAKCDCYNIGLFEPVQYLCEKDKDYGERLDCYKENSYDEFKVALIDVEQDFDPKWASRVGVDGRRLARICADTAEEAIDIYEELLRSGVVDMICLDSIAAMSPSDEVKKSAEDNALVSKGALLFNSFCRKYGSAVTAVTKEFGKIPTQIWINQPREKIGATYGKKTFLPMGRGQLFTASVIVDGWTSNWSKEERFKDLSEHFRVTVGKKVRINFRTDKNKTAPAKAEGSYILNVDGDEKGSIDEIEFILAMAGKFGEFEKMSATKWRLGIMEYKRKGDLIDALKEPREMSRVKGLLLRKMLGKI